MPKRIAIPAAVLLASLIATSGCDRALGGSKNPLPTPTPLIAGVPTLSLDVPPGISTVVIPPVSTAYTDVYVPPVPSVAYPVPPTPTEYVSNAEGDTPEAQAVVDKWNVAYRSLNTISAKQELLLVNVDGSMASQPVLELGGVLSTEETWSLPHPGYELTGARFRIKEYTQDGFVLNVFDSSGDYLIGSLYSNELHKALPSIKGSSAIPSHSAVYVSSFFYSLKPRDYSMYTFVGNSVIDGHSVIEIKGARIDNTDSTLIYLDESNFIPYRIIHEPEQGRPGWQSTLTDVKMNEPVLDSDLEAGLPRSADTVTVFDPTNSSGNLPTYESLHDPGLAAGFNLFEPPSGSSNVATTELVEQNGTRTPILSFYTGNPSITIIEGAYLPKVLTQQEWFIMQEAAGDPIDVGGLPGTIVTVPSAHADGKETAKLRFQRDGTWIQIEAGTLAEALEVAESLQPVK